MHLWRLTRLLAVPLVFLGTFLHLTVRDSWQPLAAVFYGLPLPVLAAGWFVPAFAWGWKRRTSPLCLVLAAGCGAWWFAVSHRVPAVHSNQHPALKVLFWNMAHRALPSTGLEDLLQKHTPDIAGFVEVGLRHGDPNPLTSTLPAGFTALKLDHGMAAVVRGQVKVLRQELLPGGSKFCEVEATVDGAAWHVFIVDGVSRPTTSRTDLLERVLALCKGMERTLVIGDFNTPVESSHFTAWNRELHHAFNEAGRGFRETWPRWVPVLTIDHIWSSAGAPPLNAQRVWHDGSDHAALVAELGRRMP